MAIFDIFEEVSEKSVTKSETGDARVFGVIIGEVVKNYAQEFPGRVCVKIHVRDEDKATLKWARVAMPSSGTDWGHYFLPEVGDQVLVVFDQGILDRPYIIGCIPKNNDKFLSKSKDQDNVNKTIVTKHGNTLLFYDAKDGEGENDKIRIFTPDEAHELTLDNQKHQIVIQDKEEKTKVIMGSQKGEISIKADSKLTINVGENITLSMNGNSGKVTLNASQLSIDVTGKISASAGGNVNISGSTIKGEAQASLNLSAVGMTKLTGMPVKLGG